MVGGSGNGSWDDDALAAVSTAWTLLRTFSLTALYACAQGGRNILSTTALERVSVRKGNNQLL